MLSSKPCSLASLHQQDGFIAREVSGTLLYFLSPSNPSGHIL